MRRVPFPRRFDMASQGRSHCELTFMIGQLASLGSLLRLMNLRELSVSLWGRHCGCTCTCSFADPLLLPWPTPPRSFVRGSIVLYGTPPPSPLFGMRAPRVSSANPGGVCVVVKDVPPATHTKMCRLGGLTITLLGLCSACLGHWPRVQ